MENSGGGAKSQSKVEAQIQQWAEELIDLSGRNRLVNFRHTKSTTFEFKQDALVILERLADERQKPWRFFRPERPEEDSDEEAQIAERLPRPSPDELVTVDSLGKFRSEMDRGVKSLASKSQAEYLDTGLSVLYMGMGFLEWEDIDGKNVRSPLVMVPVLLRKLEGHDEFTVQLNPDADWAVNPALALKLERDFDIEMPTADVDGPEDLLRLLDDVSEVAADSGWSVTSAVVLAAFSFQKEVIYRDLINNTELITAHPTVRLLAEGPGGAAVDFSFQPVPEDELDERQPPELISLIMSADGTQRRCIEAARDGHSFVMDGPPGTGKSQTIANLIAQLIREGKTVLFVSEKAAALEVVQNRLEAPGVELGPFLLALHSHKATRKAVAAALGEALALRPSASTTFSEADRRTLVADRKKLTAYAIGMNEVRTPLGQDLHSTIGQLSSLESNGAVDPGVVISSVGEFGAPELGELRDAAGRLSRAWGPVSRGPDFGWRELEGTTASAVEARSRRALGTMTGALQSLGSAADALADRFDLPHASSPAAAEQLMNLAVHFAVTPEVTVDAANDPSVPERFGALADEAERMLAADALVAENGLTAEAVSSDALILLEGARQQAGALVPPVSVGEFDSDALDLLQSQARELRASGDGLSDPSAILTRAFRRVDEPLPISELVDLAQLAPFTSGLNRPLSRWLSDEGIEHSRRVIDVLAAQTARVEAGHEAIGGTFRADVTALDLVGLRARFSELHSGLGKLRKQYRDDKRLLGGATVLGKLTLEAISMLDDAVGLQADERRLGAERTNGNEWIVGYGSADVIDFEGLNDAHALATAAFELAPTHADPVRLGEALSQPAGSTAEIRAAADVVNSFADQLRLFAETAGIPDAVLLAMTLDELSDWAVSILQSTRGASETLSALGGASPLSLQSAASFIEDSLAARSLRRSLDQLTVDLAALGAVVSSNDPKRLREAAGWLGALSSIWSAPITAQTFALLLASGGDTGAVRNAVDEHAHAAGNLLDGFAAGGYRNELHHDLFENFIDCADLVDHLTATVDDIHEWFAYDQAVEDLRELGLGACVEVLRQQRAADDILAVSLEGAFFRSWIELVSESDQRLLPQRSVDRDEVLERFRRSDRELTRLAAADVINSCAARRPKSNVGEAGIIQQQAQLKRRHKQIRALLTEAGRAAQSLKPCFMMSPMSVSQFLPPDLSFDVVIFDEASQVREADAIGAIYRGAQLIVAGDQKQLPPTSFFQRARDEDEDPFGDDEEFELHEFESVLDRCKAQGFTSLPLRWHYRSRHEDLITFSNRSFYHPQMHTFPGAVHTAPDLGVEFFRVEGCYQRGGLRDNREEATAVIDRVLFHRRNHPEQTLGVVTLSSAQASAVEFELEDRARNEPELRDLAMDDRLQGFFIKNLENVQGDERDIIIMSIGYGPDEHGKFTMNFGPMNQRGGERRLNVAVTRARRKVEVVASFDPPQIETSNPTLMHLARYLDYADRGIAALAIDEVDSVGEPDSPFEEEVAAAVRSMGYEAVPQVGVAGYRLDIGVRHPTEAGRYVLGIECDGASYHSSKVARDRDRLRQEVLEGLDWVIHRVWSTAWFSQRTQEIERIRQAIEAAFAGKVPSPDPQPAIALVVDAHEFDFTAPPEWANAWTDPVVPPVRTGLEFTDPLARGDVADRIMLITDKAGPIHSDSVLRVVRTAFGLGRSGSRIRAAFDAVVSGLVTRGRLVQEGEFLDLPDRHVDVRVPMESGAPSRPISEVSPRELRLALSRLLEDAGGSVGKEELRTRCARLFGWDRVGPDIERTLQDPLDELLPEQ